jgi:hypothetical protein
MTFFAAAQNTSVFAMFKHLFLFRVTALRPMCVEPWALPPPVVVVVRTWSSA